MSLCLTAHERHWLARLESTLYWETGQFFQAHLCWTLAIVIRPPGARVRHKWAVTLFNSSSLLLSSWWSEIWGPHYFANNGESLLSNYPSNTETFCDSGNVLFLVLKYNLITGTLSENWPCPVPTFSLKTLKWMKPHFTFTLNKFKTELFKITSHSSLGLRSYT